MFTFTVNANSWLNRFIPHVESRNDFRYYDRYSIIIVKEENTVTGLSKVDNIWNEDKIRERYTESFGSLGPAGSEFSIKIIDEITALNFYETKVNSYYHSVNNVPYEFQKDRIEYLILNLKSGMSLDEIVMKFPESFRKYEKVLMRVEDVIMNSRVRTQKTYGIWYWGLENIAVKMITKSNKIPSKNVYIFPDDNDWWDDYQQQDTVLINEYSGSPNIDLILRLVDDCPMYVKRRNRRPISFTSKKLIVSSHINPCSLFTPHETTLLQSKFEIIHIPSIL